MAEEAKEAEVEVLEEEKSLEEVIEKADVYVKGEKVDPEEIKKAEEAKETAEKPEEKEETPGTPETTETPEAETKEAESTEEKPPEVLPEEELFTKHPEAKEWKDVHDNYTNWEKSLRQKAMSISWLSKLDETSQETVLNNVLPYVTGKEKTPKASKELIDEVLKGITVEDLRFQDEDDIDVKVSSDKLNPVIRGHVEQALNNALPQLSALRQQNMELLEKVKESEGSNQALTGRLGEMEFETLITRHPSLNIKRVDSNESILDAVKRVYEAGDGHPDLPKLLKLRAIGGLAKEQGWSPDQAYEKLYGEEERQTKDKKREEEAALEKQKTSTQEKPSGEQPKTKEDWEEAIGTMGQRERILDEEFRKAGV